MLIGETCTGRQGKKERLVSNGAKKAIPNPPLVMASSTPCEAVTAKKNATYLHHCLPRHTASLAKNSVTTIIASLLTIPLPRPADWSVPASLFLGYGIGSLLLALAGLAAQGERGPGLAGHAGRGALFLSHWLLVVPAALLRIAAGRHATSFVQTRRTGHLSNR